MSYRVITAVATEPVTLAEARLNLKIDSDNTADDTIITALITAAREFAEHYTGKAFAPQTLEMAFTEFPTAEYDEDGGDKFITLYLPPVASITSIKYTDLAGDEQTISAANYIFSLYGSADRIAAAYGYFWPTPQDVEDAIRVRYVTGYTTLPSAGKAAMLLIISHLYENRQAVSTLNAEELPMGAKALLDTIKLWSR